MLQIWYWHPSDILVSVGCPVCDTLLWQTPYTLHSDMGEVLWGKLFAEIEDGFLASVPVQNTQIALPKLDKYVKWNINNVLYVSGLKYVTFDNINFDDGLT